MKFLNERQARREIVKALDSGGMARFAVAFWGDGAVARLGIDRHVGRVEIVCNLIMGGTNPKEIERLLDLGVQVRHSDRLHAKVYLFEDRVVVGSSNASSNGLAFQEDEEKGWLEANIVTDDPTILRQTSRWWDGLSAKRVTPADLKAAATAWKRRRSAIQIDPVRASLIAELRHRPTILDGRNVFLAVYGTEMDKEGETGLADARSDFGSLIDAFQDWPTLPPEGHLVCFWRGPRGGLTADGIYERRRNPPDRGLLESTLQLCWPEDHVFGLRVFGKDLPAWREVCERVVTSEFWDSAEGCGLVDLSVVARRFLD